MIELPATIIGETVEKSDEVSDYLIFVPVTIFAAQNINGEVALGVLLREPLQLNAMIQQTRPVQKIGIQLNHSVIEGIRIALAEAETILSQKPGNA